MLVVAILTLIFGYGQYYGGVCFLICELLITEVFWELLVFMIDKKAKVNRIRNFAVSVGAILSSMYMATLIATLELLTMTNESDFEFACMILIVMTIVTILEVLLLVSILSKSVFTYKKQRS